MLVLLKQYLWVFNLVAILLCAYFGAKLTNLYIENKITVESAAVKPPPPPSADAAEERESPPFSKYQVILERNIFDSTEYQAEEAAIVGRDETPIPSGEAVKTGLNIQVVGVLMVGEGKDPRSSATVSGGTGRGVSIDTYAVGDENGFAPNTKLVQIKMDRIEFLHNNRLEYAPFEEDAATSIFGPPPSDLKTAAAMLAPQPFQPGEGIQKEAEGKFMIDQREVQNALTNIDRLYTEIRAVPNFAGGKVSGMKILSVKQGSIFDKLGLQRGDILKKINGLELDVKRGFEIFSQLKDSNQLSVDLIRQGQNETFEYEIR
ncbi:MAG: hypothetical protein HY466_03330 [Deltaproteobacteria bacterium]|nr:hypothetical protein [Deltaproteobacteria bacterium]